MEMTGTALAKLTPVGLLAGLCSGCVWPSHRTASPAAAPGSQYTKVTAPAQGAEDQGPLWSHDGRAAYFERSVLQGAEAWTEIRRAGLQTDAEEEIARGDNIALSPDGSELAYRSIVGGQYGPIVVLNLATRRETPLGVTGEGIAWSPGQDRIAYWRYGPTAIRVLDLQSGREEVIGRHPIRGRPSWSPDGHFIAYRCVGQSGGKEEEQLHLFDLQRRDDRTLAGVSVRGAVVDHSTGWSPDGSALLVTGETPALQTRIFRLTVATMRAEPLTPGPRDREAAWSPDGTRAAYTKYAGGTGKPDYHIAVLDLNTRRETLFTEHSLRGPHWSPDSRYLACEGSPDEAGVWIISVSPGTPARG
jgi:Tol biopolymer transport system component